MSGNQVKTTNDQQVIKSDSSIRYVTQNVIAKQPELIGYVAVKAETVTYGHTQETSVVFASEKKESVEVTTILDTETNKVEIVNTQVIKPTYKPYVQTIPSSMIRIVAKKFKEIKTMITDVKSTETSMTVQSITVKDYQDSKIYTTVLTSGTTEEKVQYVYVYNKKTKDIKQIDRVTVVEAKNVFYETTTNKYDETVIKTNNVVMISKEKPEVEQVFTSIESTYGSIKQEVQSVQVVEQEYSTEYQIVAQVQGTTQTITAIKKDNTIEVLGMESITTQHHVQ